MTMPHISPRRALLVGTLLLLAALAYVFVPYWLAANQKPILEPNLWIAGGMGAAALILLFSPGHLVGLIRRWVGRKA